MSGVACLRYGSRVLVDAICSHKTKERDLRSEIWNLKSGGSLLTTAGDTWMDANSTLCASGVLPPHPDIEGIGTRLATYLQLLLAILTIAFSTNDADAFHSWWAILVTSAALILAAIAQHASLALFHALVVTWLTFPVFAMSWAYIFLHWRRKAMPTDVLIATHFHGILFVG